MWFLSTSMGCIGWNRHGTVGNFPNPNILSFLECQGRSKPLAWVPWWDLNILPLFMNQYHVNCRSPLREQSTAHHWVSMLMCLQYVSTTLTANFDFIWDNHYALLLSGCTVICWFSEWCFFWKSNGVLLKQSEWCFFSLMKTRTAGLSPHTRMMCVVYLVSIALAVENK